WALVLSDFWPIVGISALILLLVQAASSTAVGIVAGGPLMGGLWLYLLKKARHEQAGVDTAFAGFRVAFLNLFLAGFVTFLLTLIGFICLILPGIYLAVAWMFALVLVIDKQMDFWPAMELSRKTVGKHWWKFFGFWLVLVLMNLVGLMLCWVGFFLTAPVALAATVYAYEDIFGAAASAARQASAGVGPTGTAVMPSGSTKPAYGGGGAWKPAVIGLVALVLIIGLIATFAHARKRHRIAEAAWTIAPREQEAAVARPGPMFAPVIEPV